MTSSGPNLIRWSLKGRIPLRERQTGTLSSVFRGIIFSWILPATQVSVEEDFQPPGKQPSWYHEHSPINVNSESKLPMSTLSLEETETLKGGWSKWYILIIYYTEGETKSVEEPPSSDAQYHSTMAGTEAQLLNDMLNISVLMPGGLALTDV